TSAGGMSEPDLQESGLWRPAQSGRTGPLRDAVPQDRTLPDPAPGIAPARTDPPLFLFQGQRKPQSLGAARRLQLAPRSDAAAHHRMGLGRALHQTAGQPQTLESEPGAAGTAGTGTGTQPQLPLPVGIRPRQPDRSLDQAGRYEPARPQTLCGI